MTTRTQNGLEHSHEILPLRIKLELLSGPMDGMEYELEKESISIGRGEQRDVSLPLDTLISRGHARIIIGKDQCWLEDEGSRNGTYIGDKLAEGRVALPFGVIFRMGRTEMRILSTE